MKATVSSSSKVWIDGEDGHLYVCPIDIKKQAKDGKISVEELKKYCLDEADRPWND